MLAHYTEDMVTQGPSHHWVKKQMTYVSSLLLHLQDQSNTMIHRFFRLSMVKFFPKEAVQMKKAALRGALHSIFKTFYQHWNNLFKIVVRVPPRPRNYLIVILSFFGLRISQKLITKFGKETHNLISFIKEFDKKTYRPSMIIK